jgi:translation initiation factor IF-3
VKFRPKIDEHDFQFKKRNAERFLLDGNKVKSTVIFRGREMAHNEIGRRILVRLAAELTEVANVEVPPRQEGMTMVQILNPKRDPAAAAKPARAKGDGAEAPAEKKPRAAAARTEGAAPAPAKKKKPAAEPAAVAGETDKK